MTEFKHDEFKKVAHTYISNQNFFLFFVQQLYNQLQEVLQI